MSYRELIRDALKPHTSVRHMWWEGRDEEGDKQRAYYVSVWASVGDKQLTQFTTMAPEYLQAAFGETLTDVDKRNVDSVLEGLLWDLVDFITENAYFEAQGEEHAETRVDTV